MEPLLSMVQIRAADRFCIERLKIPEIILMEHAGLGVVNALTRRFGSTLQHSRGLILAGPGNNGGDALAAARMLILKGTKYLDIVLLGNQLSPSCAQQKEMLKKLECSIHSSVPSKLESYDWILDGLFGTGLARNLEGKFLDCVSRVNEMAARAWIVAIDIPSGLHADTGCALGDAIRACETIALGFYKPGLLTGQSADYVGRLSLAPLQMPRNIPKITPVANWFQRNDARAFLPARRPASHKGNYGHLYIWAGEAEKEGASALAALGGLRTGCGLVTVIGSRHLEAIRPRLAPEIMTRTVNSDFFTKEDSPVVVLGPGLGLKDDAWQTVRGVLSSQARLVLDGDALTLLSEHAQEAKSLISSRENTILTPHPKEASRLLDCSVDAVEGDRLTAIQKLTSAFKCTVVLKGKGTLILSPSEKTTVVTAGNSALSKGGSGDVLSGLIGGLWSQNTSAHQAACLGTFLHGTCADYWVQRYGSERSPVISDIVAELPVVWSELEAKA